MTGVAIDLLRQVTKAGGTVQLEGDALRLWAPEPLPDDLRARLRQHKAEIVALLTAAEPTNDPAPETPPSRSVAGPPREIANGVRAILTADGARGIPPQRWPRVQRDAARLAEGGWAQQALGLGWTPADLFGLAPARPSRSRPADRRARDRRADRGRRGAQDIDRIGAALSPTAAGKTACGSALGAPDPHSGHRATYPRANNTSEQGADGGDVLGRTPPPS